MVGQTKQQKAPRRLYSPLRLGEYSDVVGACVGHLGRVDCSSCIGVGASPRNPASPIKLWPTFRRRVWSFPLEAVTTGTTVGWLSGAEGVTAEIADEASVLVGSQRRKISARGAVGAPQNQDGIRHGEAPPFLPLSDELYLCLAKILSGCEINSLHSCLT
jgi:hypothetical protein